MAETEKRKKRKRMNTKEERAAEEEPREEVEEVKAAEEVPPEEVEEAKEAEEIPSEEAVPEERSPVKRTILERCMKDPSFRRRVIYHLVKKLR